MTHPLDEALAILDCDEFLSHVADSYASIHDQALAAVMKAARKYREMQRLEADGKIRIIEVDAEPTEAMVEAAAYWLRENIDEAANNSWIARAGEFKAMIRAAGPSRLLQGEE